MCVCVLCWNRNPTVLNDLWLKSSMSTLWFTVSPHVTVHTHAQMNSASYWRHSRAYESACTHAHTHLRASTGWADIRNIVIRCCSLQVFPSMYRLQFSFRPWRLRKKSCDVLIEMITILFFTSVFCFIGSLHKVKADSKQTNKQRKWGGKAHCANKPPSEIQDMWLVNSNGHDKPW